MTGRVNPFADLTSPLSSFTVKPKKDKPVTEAAITRLAEENNFPSRQAPKIVREPKRRRRAYTTGRNQQVNFKATAATIERFHNMADERNVALCALFEQALDALERAGESE
jgi:hypothetical protein